VRAMSCRCAPVRADLSVLPVRPAAWMRLPIGARLDSHGRSHSTVYDGARPALGAGPRTRPLQTPAVAQPPVLGTALGNCHSERSEG
jgi:hypothetical protein